MRLSEPKHPRVFGVSGETDMLQTAVSDDKRVPDTRHIARFEPTEYASGILAVENMARHGLDGFIIAVKRIDGSYSHYEIKLRSDNADEISDAVKMAIAFYGVRVH